MKNLHIILLLVAAAVPLCVGTYFYCTILYDFVVSDSNRNTFYIHHIAFTNLMATGLTCLCLVWFGIRKKIKWCWFLCLTIFLWSAVNDAFALTYQWIYNQGFFPIVYLPLTLGSIGFLLSYSHLFNDYTNKENQ